MPARATCAWSPDEVGRTAVDLSEPCCAWPRTVAESLGVTGEVQQHQVVRLAVGEEILDVPLHDVGGCIVHSLDAEAADLLVAQDVRQGLRIGCWGPQAAQPRVLILVVRNDQGCAPAVHD
jgi:hypothetical protein